MDIKHYKQLKLLNDQELLDYTVRLMQYVKNETQSTLTYRLCAQTYGMSTTELIRKRCGPWCELLIKSNTPHERVGKQTLQCRQCDKEIQRYPGAVKKETFCSRSCAATYNNKAAAADMLNERYKKRTITCINTGKWNKRNPRIRVQAHNLICQECASRFWQRVNIKRIQKFCSKKCRSTYASRRQTEFLRNNPDRFKEFRLGRGKNKQSYMEQSFGHWLLELGVVNGLSGFLSEIHFYDKTRNVNGWIDFMFPRKRVIVELDGSHHKRRIEQDAKRDDFLRERGWTVIRISHAEYINKRKMDLIYQILTEVKL